MEKKGMEENKDSQMDGAREERNDKWFIICFSTKVEREREQQVQLWVGAGSFGKGFSARKRVLFLPSFLVAGGLQKMMSKKSGRRIQKWFH